MSNFFVIFVTTMIFLLLFFFHLFFSLSQNRVFAGTVESFSKTDDISNITLIRCSLNCRDQTYSFIRTAYTCTSDVPGAL